MKNFLIILISLFLLSCEKDKIQFQKVFGVSVIYNGSPEQLFFDVEILNTVVENGDSILLKNEIRQDNFVLLLSFHYLKGLYFSEIREFYQYDAAGFLEDPPLWNFQLKPGFDSSIYMEDGEQFGSIEFLGRSEIYTDGNSRCFDVEFDFYHFSNRKPIDQCSFPTELCINEFTGSATTKICLT